MKTTRRFFWALAGVAAIAAIAFFMRRTETPQVAAGETPTPVQAEQAAATMSGQDLAAAQPQQESSASAALVAEATARHVAPSMDAPWNRFAQAEVVESREGQPDADGMVERIRLVKTGMKYPNVRIVEKVRALDPTGTPVSFSAAVADHMMVRVRDGLSEEKVATIASQHGFSVRKKMLAPDTYLIAFGNVSIDALPTALEAFNAEANAIQYAEPDYVVFASATMPNDPAFNQLWGMHQQKDKDIDAPEAWDLTQGSSNVVVAVIDTGIDYGHEDLSANMWLNPGEIPGNGIDDDGNGFRDDVYGWDFCNEDSDPYDDNFHGTHCAGTIGAAGNNGIGVAGVNWGVKLMAVKTMNQGGSGYISDAIDAVYYTTRRGVRLTSNSWGYYGWIQSLKDAIDDAGTSNILFVAAAGNEQNDNDNNPCYPASFVSANIISVAATDADDDLTWFSNYGKTAVDLGAPGEYIYSTVPTAQGKYASYSGTSMAAPHVAGVAALVAAYSPALTAAQIKQRILDNTDRSSTLSGKTVTGGRLNAYKSLSGAVPLEPPAAPSVLTATPYTNRVELAWTDNATNETAFVVERRSGSSGFTAIATLAANATSRTDTNVMGGVTYVYRVKATNAAGSSAYSSEASATVPGAADAWDPGNDAGVGAILLSPITTNEASHGPHTLSGTDPYDWFKANLVAGSTYNFNSIGGSGDVYADLFRDAAGTQLVLADDDGGGGLMFMLEFTADSTATYYIRVRTEPVGNNAAYNIKYSLTGSSNQPPTVALTSPASNAVYQAPAIISIAANASDPDGSIADVKFFNGSTLLSTDTDTPYAYSWGGVGAGSYTLKAVATDNGGTSVTSAPVAVVVNAQPTVTLTSPSNGASYVVGTAISIGAAVLDTDGTITQVAFYDGATLLNTDTSSPYGYSWTNAAVGSHVLFAVATDNRGGSGVSATTTVAVVAAQPVLTVTPTNINLQVLAGQNAASGTFTVANSGSGAMNYGIYESIAWLSVSPTNGSSTGVANTHAITYSTAGLATGTYSGTITVTAAGSTGSPKAIAVNLLVSSSPLDTGLAAYYPFNGNANDESGNGNHLVALGPAPTQDRYNNENSAYLFDGVDDRVVATNTTDRHVDLTNTFSLSAWFKPVKSITLKTESGSGVSGVSQPYVLFPRHYGADSGIGFAAGLNGINVFEHGNSFLPAVLVYAFDFGSNWVHVVITCENNGAPILYINGSKIRQGVQTGRIKNLRLFSTPSTEGIGGGGYGSFNGPIDDIRIYNRALTSNEVWELYGGGSASISGTISYSGSQTGQIVVVAGSYTNKIAAPGAYSISSLPTPGTYSVTAFRDVNGNNQRDASEPYGQYAVNPVNLTNNVTGANITLTDPVSSSLSISGNVAYGGSYTGSIVVSAVAAGAGSVTGDIYVATSGNDTTGTGSQANPYATIQKAINVAATGKTIVVAPGTYSQNIQITNKTLQLVSSMGPAQTTIQGSALNTVVYLSSGASNTVVKGFRITGGTGKPSPSSYGNDYYGGGIHCGTTALIQDCIIDGNGKGTPRSNSGTFGGAIYSAGGNLRVVNCLMFNNFAWASGGATLTEQGTIEIDRCTVYGNDSTSFFGYQGGLGLANNGGMTVNSSIVWGNGGDEIGAFSSPYNAGTRATVSYCDVDGGPTAGGIPAFTIGSGNLNADPQFINAAQTNFELSASSPCINTGDPAASDPDGTRADIGYKAARFQNSGSFTASTTIAAPGPYAITNLLPNLNYTVTAYRDINGNGGKDSFEPQGSYSNNPIYLTNSVTNAHITLADPDTDGDGLIDAYEIGYGRYQIITGAFTWAQAKVDAEARGGHMATITSAPEWNIINDMFGSELFLLFFGGSDEEFEGVWKWITGEKWGYTRWCPGAPDNYQGIQHYLWFHTENDLLWNDVQNDAAPDIKGYLFEIGYYTSPTDSDTDDDGLTDGQEVNAYMTDPGNPDTDGDGLNDGAEVTAGTNPLDPDSDDDGLNDYYELVTLPCLDPLDADSDNDGIDDGAEVAGGSDPCSADNGLFSIAGTVTYSGDRTGQVIVTASAVMPTNGLAAYYPFNENANDESGNGSHGSLFGSILVADRWSKPESAYYFDGNSYIRCNGMLQLPVGNLARTLSVWVKSSDGLQHNNSDHIVNWGSAWSSHAFGVMLFDQNHWWGYGHGHPIYDCDSGITADTNWHHLVVTYGDNMMSIYVDGNLGNSLEMALNTDGNDLAIGIRQDITYDNTFHGVIDDIRIYNRALTSNEVSQLYAFNQHSSVISVPDSYLITNIVGGLEYAVTAFMDCDGNGVLDDDEPRGSYAANPVLVTNNVTGVDIELTVPSTGWTMRATHALAEYDSPGSNTVACEVYYPTNQSLLGLGWTVGLPEGWSLLSAAGDGEPVANPANNEILFSGPALTNNPIRFTYDVSVPVGQSGPKSITGTVDYYLTGIATWEVRMAEPDPLIVNPASPYHSADFRNPKWVIDLQECNRTLSYWRSRGYGVRSDTVDGYEADGTSQDGSRHKADYREPYWKLDGQEALRVIGYWMAGGYHQEASGADGYAPGMSTNGAMGIMDVGDISAMSVAPATYMPGHEITLRGTLSYSNDIVGLLWRPQLPDGWTIISVSANGGMPEVVDNEILFTTKLPPSPLEITYVCNVPGEMSGDALVQTDVQLMRQGSANPQSLFGMMAPNMLQLDTDGDGLPDWVETNTRVYVSPTDTGTDPNDPDTDDDGVLDGDEVPAGTNPNQAGDAFKITSFAAKTGDFIMAVRTPYEVKWSSVAGKTYSVFRTTNLLSGFLILQSNVLATPPVNTFIDTLPPEPKASYSVGVE